MRTFAMTVAALAFLASGATPLYAQSAAPKPGVEKEAAGHRATGVVKKVDRANGSVTLAHDPIPSLSWPAMTMAFSVKDQPLYDKLQPGAKVDFQFVQQGREHVITSVK